MPLDEERFQRGVSGGAGADLDHLQRIEGIDDGTRTDRNAGGAQRAGKADDVVGHLARRGREMIDGHRRKSQLPSFRGARSASPESITTIGSMDSGLAPSGAPR